MEQMQEVVAKLVRKNLLYRKLVECYGLSIVAH